MFELRVKLPNYIYFYVFYINFLAKISIELEKKEEAKEYARKALQLAAIKEPQLDNYSQLGVVKVSDSSLLYKK